MKENKNDILDCALSYAKLKLEMVGCEDLSAKIIRTDDDWLVAEKAFKEESLWGLVYILCIGFANGVKYEREKLSKTS